MHPAAMAFVRRMVTEHNLNRKKSAVLEIGSYDVNGSVRPLFDAASRYVGIDVRPGRGVDVVADGAEYDDGKKYDVIVTTETLEHTEHPEAIIANAHRLLKPGGALIVTAAAPGRAPHSVDGTRLEAGEPYTAIDPKALLDWLEPFSERYVEPNLPVHDVYAFAVKDAD